MRWQAASPGLPLRAVNNLLFIKCVWATAPSTQWRLCPVAVPLQAATSVLYGGGTGGVELPRPWSPGSRLSLATYRCVLGRAPLTASVTSSKRGSCSKASLRCWPGGHLTCPSALGTAVAGVPVAVEMKGRPGNCRLPSFLSDSRHWASICTPLPPPRREGLACWSTLSFRMQELPHLMTSTNYRVSQMKYMQGEGICLLIALELTALKFNFKDCSSLGLLPAFVFHPPRPSVPCNFLLSAASRQPTPWASGSQSAGPGQILQPQMPWTRPRPGSFGTSDLGPQACVVRGGRGSHGQVQEQVVRRAVVSASVFCHHW